MSPEKHILLDLYSGPSTAAAIADRMGQPVDMITTLINRLIAENKIIIRRHLGGTIPIYQLSNP